MNERVPGEFLTGKENKIFDSWPTIVWLHLHLEDA